MKRWLVISAAALMAACGGLPPVNSEPKYTTKYGASEVVFRGASILKYSDAPRRGPLSRPIKKAHPSIDAMNQGWLR